MNYLEETCEVGMSLRFLEDPHSEAADERHMVREILVTLINFR